MTDFESILKEMEAEGITHESIMESQAVDDGWDLAQYRKIRELRLSLQDKAKNIIDKPVKCWPSFDINWDLCPNNFRFAFDGMSPNQYAKEYPNGLKLCWVFQTEFYNSLCHYNKRSPEELWELGFAGKLAHVIAYCSEGNPLTPVVAMPQPHFDGEVLLLGGNHRYAMINVLNIKVMPLLVQYEDHDEMTKRLPSLSDNIEQVIGD
ncbi:hypothetical protein [Glaciecola sp. 1036]|uniref:hypothetical protein n=1 Tax=Alteromonadaceae TaxID=72275 RepID=UPI003CFDDC9E